MEIITRKQINLIFVLILFLNKFFYSDSKLTSVISLNRHGARTYKGFTKIDENSFFDKSHMSLTIVGYAQLQLLGSYLNEKYIETGFIAKKYKEPDVKIISSATSRTINSAAALISGLFPKAIVTVDYTNSTKAFPLTLKNDYPVPIEDFNYDDKLEEVPIYINKENQIFRSKNCFYKGKKLIKQLEKGNDTILEPLSDEELHHFIDEMYTILKDWEKDNQKVEKYSIRNFWNLANELKTMNFHFNQKIKLSKESRASYHKYFLKFYEILINPQNKDTVNMITSDFFKRIIEIFNYHVLNSDPEYFEKDVNSKVKSKHRDPHMKKRIGMYFNLF